MRRWLPSLAAASLLLACSGGGGDSSLTFVTDIGRPAADPGSGNADGTPIGRDLAGDDAVDGSRDDASGDVPMIDDPGEADVPEADVPVDADGGGDDGAPGDDGGDATETTDTPRGDADDGGVDPDAADAGDGATDADAPGGDGDGDIAPDTHDDAAGDTGDGGSDEGTGGCEVATDCPAPAPCRTARCEAGECVEDVVPPGSACSPTISRVDPQCVVGTCDAVGSCSALLRTGRGCDDEDPCTVDDVCGDSGRCEGAQRTCPATGPCTVGRCDDATGACITDASPDGSDCDHVNPCIAGATCAQGVCGGGENTCECAGDDDCPDDGDACNGVLTCVDGEAGAACELAADSVVVCGQSADPCFAIRCEPSSGACVSAVLAGERCDDGDPCTEADRCQDDGACVGSSLECDDGNPCTSDRCDAAAGGCVASNTAGPCNDGDACTASDTCRGGACGGTLRSCDDGDPCTADRCEAGSCVRSPADGEACDDGEICTVDDVCAGGACRGTARRCDDDNPCTTDACVAGRGCTSTDNSRPCDDGEPCTEADVCSGGACAGTRRDCDDGVDCTTDDCTDGVGCVYTAQHGACDDGKVCTDDTCSPALGGCDHQPNAAPCDDDDACTANDRCSNGACRGEGATCNDGVACTRDGCDALGGCVHEPVDALCDDGEGCTTDSCDADAGCQNLPLDGAECSDGAACTEGDQCVAGRCQPGDNTCECDADADCDDDNPCNGTFGCEVGDDGLRRCVARDAPITCAPSEVACQVSRCDPAMGACSLEAVDDGAPCSDDEPCTTDERCVGGACATSPTSCDDGVPCTNDRCVSGVGCENEPNDGACDDGADCTLDSCDPTDGCVRVAEHTRCDDGVDCTVDRCGEDGVCTFTPDDARCADDHDCTIDTCTDSGCEHAADHDRCADDEPCTADACDIATGCRNEPVDGPCTDANACTDGDVCVDGRCESGTPRTCIGGGPCTDARCDAATGDCVEVPADEGALCDDGDACTLDDRCVGGACTGGSEDPCSDGIDCTTDSCGADGCAHAAVDAACDDGNPCTVDRCVVGVGCQHEALRDFSACNDGIAATGPDVCFDGLCHGFQQVTYNSQLALGANFCGTPSAGQFLSVGRYRGNFFATAWHRGRRRTGLFSCANSESNATYVVRLNGSQDPALLSLGTLAQFRGGILRDVEHDLAVGDDGAIGQITGGGNSFSYGSSDLDDELAQLSAAPGTLRATWGADLRGPGGDVVTQLSVIVGRADGGQEFLAACERSASEGTACERLFDGIGRNDRRRLSPVAADGRVGAEADCGDCDEILLGAVFASNDTDGGNSLVRIDDELAMSRVSGGSGATWRTVALDADLVAWVAGDSGDLRSQEPGAALTAVPLPDGAGALSITALHPYARGLVVVGHGAFSGSGLTAQGVFLMALDAGADPAEADAWRVVHVASDARANGMRADAAQLYVVGANGNGTTIRFWHLDY